MTAMMNVNYAISTDVLSLPEVFRVRSRFEINPQEHVWRVPDSSKMQVFNFDSVAPYCSDEMMRSLKKVLLWYLQRKSATHASNLFQQFRRFAEEMADEVTPLACVSDYHIISYHGNLPTHHEWYLGALSGLLQKWYELGYPGVDAEAYSFLNEIKVKGNRKGWAVLTMDPEQGPFTEMELHAIHQAINSAFANGKISNREFSLIWLFIATGARPIQIADVKIGDFKVGKASNGKYEYAIAVPRAKQRNQERRSDFKIRPLAKEIGEVVEAWVAQLKIEGGEALDNISPENLPMFPEWNALNAPGLEHHSVAHSLTMEVQNVFSKLNVKSHRTGKRMRITPQRFRYTLGTRAAMEKCSEMVIAELLDHSDTQNVKVYVKAVPEIIEHLDKAVAEELAKFADAFAGRTIQNDSPVTRDYDPAKLVRSPKLDPMKGGVGTCGGCGNCGAMVPVACYVCPNFQPWAEAPHEELLDELLQERQRWLEETGDKRTAYANDHVIVAVAQVVKMCKELKEAR